MTHAEREAQRTAIGKAAYEAAMEAIAQAPDEASRKIIADAANKAVRVRERTYEAHDFAIDKAEREAGRLVVPAKGE